MSGARVHSSRRSLPVRPKLWETSYCPAVAEAIAVAFHLQDVDVVGEAVHTMRWWRSKSSSSASLSRSWGWSLPRRPKPLSKG